MKKYLALIRASMLEALQLRVAAISNFIGNIIYIVIVYHLWYSIFFSSGEKIVNGMTFSDTIIYLVLTSALFYTIEAYLVWDTHRDIQSGKIISNLIKPIEYQSFQYFRCLGWVIFNFFSTFLPTFLIIYFLSGSKIVLSYNLLFFLISIVLSTVIHFFVDFFVGTICFYTQSVWGVNIMKEVVVMLFSGAVIPINFFPEPLKSITMYLPFQAIYNIPLQQLLHHNLTTRSRMNYICVQLLWIIVLFVVSKSFWKKGQRIITVNGG